MSILYTVLGFEPTTFRTWGSSHTALKEARVQLANFFKKMKSEKYFWTDINDLNCPKLFLVKLVWAINSILSKYLTEKWYNFLFELYKSEFSISYSFLLFLLPFLLREITPHGVLVSFAFLQQLKNS